jgi:hypothetical protein
METTVKHYVTANGTVFVITTVRHGSGRVEENKTSYTPSTNVSHLPQDIQDVCAALWTQKVVDAFFKKVNTL